MHFQTQYIYSHTFCIIRTALQIYWFYSTTIMPLSKKQKQELVQDYQKKLSDAQNVVVLRQKNVSVNDINTLRIETEAQNSQLSVIKKKIFLKSLDQTWYEAVDLSVLDGSVVLLYLHNTEDYSPLKLIEKYTKNNKKEQKPWSLEFVWAWFNKSWKDSEYVQTISSLPSKEELISKFLYLLKFPIQWTAAVLDKIREKKESTWS